MRLDHLLSKEHSPTLLVQIGAFITDRVMRTRSWVEHLTTWIMVRVFGRSTPLLVVGTVWMVVLWFF